MGVSNPYREFGFTVVLRKDLLGLKRNFYGIQEDNILTKFIWLSENFNLNTLLYLSHN